MEEECFTIDRCRTCRLATQDETAETLISCTNDHAHIGIVVAIALITVSESEEGRSAHRGATDDLARQREATTRGAASCWMSNG